MNYSSPLPSRYVDAPPGIELSDAQVAAAGRARDYLQEYLIPLEAHVPEVDPLPEQIEAEMVAEAKRRQLWAIATPTEFGGQGLGEVGYVAVREHVAQSTVGDIRHDRGAGGDPWPTLFSASGDQKRKYLEPVLAGTKRMFFGLTEPSGGSDAAGILTEATKVSGGWLINGSKRWIGRGGIADFGVVFAVTDRNLGAKGGVSAFFVERGYEGFNHVRDLVTMGACLTSELAFVNCFVPDDAVLGDVGGAFALAQRTLSRSRVRQAALNIGAAQRAFDLMVRWVPTRRTFGKSLAEREAVRWMIARAAADLQSARYLVYRVASQIDKGADPRWEVPPMKTRAAQMVCRVVDLAMQLHGALGISRDLPLERIYRDVRGFRISEGADEVQRVLVAREFAGRE